MEPIYFKTKILIEACESSLLSAYENERILVVCDPFLVNHHLISALLKKLKGKNQVTVFSDVIPDPTLEQVSNGVVVLVQKLPTIILGIGGGSAIDTAKGMIYFAKKRGGLANFEFIAIPTTSGTGTEVTSVTVVADQDSQIKHVIEHQDLLPDIALLDANLTLSVPPHLTAYTGMDVITHGLEAYVALNATAYSDALAEKALELSFKSLLVCFTQGTHNKQARLDLLIASNLAGMAFNSAGLGLSHSLAHQLGGKFKIPHGLGNAIVLEQVIAFNTQNELVFKKYANLARKLGLANKGDSDDYAVTLIKLYLKTLKKIMKLPQNLRECDISEVYFQEQITELTSNTLKDFCLKTNPVGITAKEIKEIFCKIY